MFTFNILGFRRDIGEETFYWHDTIIVDFIRDRPLWITWGNMIARRVLYWMFKQYEKKSYQKRGVRLIVDE